MSEVEAPQNFREQRMQQLIDECTQTVLQQIIQPFGLSMAMFNDQDGGDVDTVHNARKGVYATEEEKKKFENREKYDSSKYHSHEKYIDINRKVKQQKEEGSLEDAYTGELVTPDQKVDLDHTVSAHEAHNDPGAYLAEKNPANLVNTETNLNPTLSSINRSKKAKNMEKFIEDWEKQRPKRQQEIKTLSAKQHLTDKERKKLEKLKHLEQFSPEEAIKIEKAARQAYNSEINKYYTSKKFIGNSAKAAGAAAVKSAVQQAIGMLLVEFARASFHEIKMFIKERSETSKNIFQDIKDRLTVVMKKVFEKLKKWKELAQSMGEGFLSGFFSSLLTTFINIFATTAKRFVRAIREGFRSLVETFKLLFFRPKDMSEEEALKLIIKSLTGVFFTTVGIAAETALNTFLQGIPVIGQFASFITPVLLGILSGISIAIVSYLVDRAFDLFHKSEREFNNLLQVENSVLISTKSVELVMNSYISMGQTFEEMQIKYDTVIEDNFDIQDFYDMLWGNSDLIHQQNDKIISDRKNLADSIEKFNDESENISIFLREFSER